MTLKRRIAINIAIAFSLLFGTAAITIYYFFFDFRRDEFQNRLEEKALTTAKLLLEVKEIDNQLLKLIDQNTINKLYNEKTLVFDDKMQLIYSSLDDATITWDINDLKKLKTEKLFFRKDKDKDVLGIFYDFEQTDYFVLIAAEDKYGNSKLQYLQFILIVTFLTGTGLVWILTYYFIKKLLRPLDIFEHQITNISANKLNIRLKENDTKNEINLLTRAFNQMLERIDAAFDSQKDFAANASHEIRTPLTRIAFQTENLLQDTTLPVKTQTYLRSINNDVHQLSDLINSLLLLTKISKDDPSKRFKAERIDEIIFAAYVSVKQYDHAFDLDFEIIENQTFEQTLEVWAVKGLLEIAFTNLLKNACNYAFDKKATITIEQPDDKVLLVKIINSGKMLDTKEQSKLFEPFFRGSNATQTVGSGLGLRIVKRILDYHNAHITIHCQDDTYITTVAFPIQNV